jgi:hypothetical protein
MKLPRFGAPANVATIRQCFCLLVAGTGLLALIETHAAAGGADLSASLSPIGVGGPAGQRVAYLWLDLKNRAPRPQALCGDASLSLGWGNGPRAPGGGVGEGAVSHCGGPGSENLIGPGGHLIIGLRLPLLPERLVQRLTAVSVDTDSLTPAPDGGLVPNPDRPIVIEMNAGQLRHFPRLGNLPAIDTSRARDAAPFGGWSAVVRPVAGDGGASANRAYWVSLVNERPDRKAICRFLAVRVRLLALEKEIRTVEEGKIDGHECPSNVGLDSGWRLVGAGQAFSFLFPIEAKPGDEKADRLRFTIEAFEGSAKLEPPSSAFSIEAVVDTPIR